MVSFSCDTCQQVIKKPKLSEHTRRCPYFQFSCIDCSVTFTDNSWAMHTQCMSEEQKYHKTAYKKKTIVQLTPQTGESLVPAQALPTPTHSPKKEKTPDTLSKELKKVVQKALKKPRTLKRLISKLEKKNAWDQVLLKSAFVNAENQLVINL